MKKVQLYSGGMDSYIISRLYNPDVKLYIDYGTEQNKEEIKRLPDDVVIKRVDLKEYIQDDGLNTIPLRNLIFASIAVNYGEEIIIGGLKDDLHFDKTREFAESCTALFNSVLTKERQSKTVKVTVPFKGYTKKELVKLFIRSGGAVQEINDNSWSCYHPVNEKPCGQCKACKAREKAIHKALLEIEIENGIIAGMAI